MPRCIACLLLKDDCNEYNICVSCTKDLKSGRKKIELDDGRTLSFDELCELGGQIIRNIKIVTAKLDQVLQNNIEEAQMNECPFEEMKDGPPPVHRY